MLREPRESTFGSGRQEVLAAVVCFLPLLVLCANKIVKGIFVDKEPCDPKQEEKNHEGEDQLYEENHLDFWCGQRVIFA